MTKHTPGPWHVGMKPGPIIYGTKGDQVADLRGFLDIDETSANARLIAAAPCLIEALRECITEDGAACLQTGSAVALFRRLQTINDAARAALAKARGE